MNEIKNNKRETRKSAHLLLKNESKIAKGVSMTGI